MGIPSSERKIYEYFHRIKIAAIFIERNRQ